MYRCTPRGIGEKGEEDDPLVLFFHVRFLQAFFFQTLIIILFLGFGIGS